MDHRICLTNWLQRVSASQSAMDYNEWTGRGGMAAVVILNDGRKAVVRKVSGSSAKVVFADGRKASVKRVDINRVSLY